MTHYYQARRHLADLRELKARLDRNLRLMDPYRQDTIDLKRQTSSLEWALLQIDPMQEGPRQMLGELMQAAE